MLAPVFHCIFYVDTLIGTSEEFEKTTDYLKKESEMKYLGKINFCLDLQIEISSSWILVHQFNYIVNVLKHFSMDKPQPLSTPMVVWSLNINEDPYRLKEKDEKIFLEILYLSAIIIYHNVLDRTFISILTCLIYIDQY